MSKTSVPGFMITVECEYAEGRCGKILTQNFRSADAAALEAECLSFITSALTLTEDATYRITITPWGLT